MSDLERVREAAATVFKPEAIDEWLTSPNPRLDDESPLALIERGETDRVLGVVQALADGVFV